MYSCLLPMLPPQGVSTETNINPILFFFAFSRPQGAVTDATMSLLMADCAKLSWIFGLDWIGYSCFYDVRHWNIDQYRTNPECRIDPSLPCLTSSRTIDCWDLLQFPYENGWHLNQVFTSINDNSSLYECIYFKIEWCAVDFTPRPLVVVV